MNFDYSELRGRIRVVFKTEHNFAKALGISCVSLSRRLNNKSEFSQKEIKKACELLQEPSKRIHILFFTELVQKNEQKEDCR